jgi:hypothetical protein
LKPLQALTTPASKPTNKIKEKEKIMTLLNLNSPSGQSSDGKKSKKMWIGAGLVVAVLGIGSTFAANININNNDTSEFGQGFTETVYCGDNGGGEPYIITVQPISAFVNASDPANAKFELSGVKISNIPSQCEGKDFVISAYDGASASPLVLSTAAGVAPGVTEVAVNYEPSDPTPVFSFDRTSVVTTGAPNNVTVSAASGIVQVLFTLAAGRLDTDDVVKIVVETQENIVGDDA